MWTIVDKPLIAQPNAAHLSFDELLTYKSIQETRIVKDITLVKQSVFVHFLHLYKIALLNDHVWFGICFRHNGTSFTDTQRFIILLIRLLTLLAVAALFYGREQETFIGDISLSSVCSLFILLLLYLLYL